MDHLQVSVLALRETIDRQENRIYDLSIQRNALAIALTVISVLYFVCVVSFAKTC